MFIGILRSILVDYSDLLIILLQASLFVVNSCGLFWLVDVLEEEPDAAHGQEEEGPVDHPFKVLESGAEKKVLWNLELKKELKESFLGSDQILWLPHCSNYHSFRCIPPRYECIVFTFLMQDFNGLQYAIPPRYEGYRFHFHNEWFAALPPRYEGVPWAVDWFVCLAPSHLNPVWKWETHTLTH